MPIFSDVFTEVAMLLIIASVIGFVALRLRQPLIVAFIAVGVIAGPSALGWVTANDQIDLFAKLGISLLLFVVGLKLDLHIIRTMGSVALATGIGQVLFTSLTGYLIAIGLGFTPIAAVYIAVALTFSSTIIIVKLLSDKREVDSLHGRIAIGFLIVQDIMVVVAMIVLNSLSKASELSNLGVEAIGILIKGATFIVVVGLLMRYVLTPLLNTLALSKELLVLFSIAWAVSLGALGNYLGFSKEVGAFLAGVSLASTPYREVIGARLTSLRDFLLLFFFIDLGAGLELSTLGAQVGPALIFSFFVLVGNPIIVMVIMGLMGYRKRTGFLAGLTVAQISEFSLILGALGVSLGHIQGEILGLITLVGLITISASTYLILYSQILYQWLAGALSIFERKHPYREEFANSEGKEQVYDFVVFGMGRFGTAMIRDFTTLGFNVLGIDFNPEVIRRKKEEGAMVCYGDAEDAEFLSTLSLKHARYVIAAVHDKHINITLMRNLRDSGYTGKLAFTAHDMKDAQQLIQNGAVVLVPYEEAATQAVKTLIDD